MTLMKWLIFIIINFDVDVGYVKDVSLNLKEMTFPFDYGWMDIDQ